MTDNRDLVQGDADFRDNRSDEIDLFDLWDDIVDNKLWVVAGLVGCLALAGAYLAMATSVFQAQVVTKPASDIHVLELNQPQLKASKIESERGVIAFDAIYSKTVDDAYKDAQKALLSKEYRRTFYELHLEEIKAFNNVYNDQLLLSQNFANFDKRFSFSVSNDKKDTEKFSKLSLEFPNAEHSAKLLNEFAEFALAEKMQEIETTLSSKVESEIRRLEYEADKLRERYKGERNRKLLMLNEAKQVANKIGLRQPAFDKNQVLTEEPPLYMFGSDALDAEMTAIQNRQKMAEDLSFGEEYYIENLPELLYRIDQLKKLTIDYDKVKLAIIDEKAVTPTKPIKPRKLLVVALACVAGVFVGMMMALIMAAFQRHKEARREARRLRREQAQAE